MTRPQEIRELIEYHEKETERLREELEQWEYQEVESEHQGRTHR